MRGPVVLLLLAALFVVELLAWIALGTLGWQVGARWGDAAGVAGALLAFGVVVAAWALLASPRSRAPRWARWTTRVLVLGGAAAVLWAESPVAGAAFAVSAAALVAVCETAAVREVLAIVAAPRERPERADRHDRPEP